MRGASIERTVEKDFLNLEQKLKTYVDNGRIASPIEPKEEPPVNIRVDATLIKPLKKTGSFTGSFLAVDCATRTLKRANNWGVYLMRSAYAIVEGRNVSWGYGERICTAVGNAHARRSYLQDFRIEMESQAALSLLSGEALRPYYVHGDVRGLYLLLDGGGYFGGERKFRVTLYEKCEREKINLLTISKNSPSLLDEKGRDFVATTYIIAPYDLWVYHPVRKADKTTSLYGDISIIKLCKESIHAFRCDIMEYLTGREIVELLSPLTAISEDPRCLGYPIALWLAHEFSAPSDSMMLSYHDQIERVLQEADLLQILHQEELSCSFADSLHGIKHAFEWEYWDEQI